MEEVKVKSNNEVPLVVEEQKPLSVVERLAKLEQEKQVPMTTKQLKVLRKAKVRARKAKKGWIGLLKIDENGNITGEKQKVEDSVYQTKDGIYHATRAGEEVLMWDGKFPVLIQPTWRSQPLNIREGIEKNDVYGQKLIMARMLKDAIKIKNKGGSILIWVLIGAGVLFAINYFFK